jgi:hypothetical protein
MGAMSELRADILDRIDGYQAESLLFAEALSLALDGFLTPAINARIVDRIAFLRQEASAP